MRLYVFAAAALALAAPLSAQRQAAPSAEQIRAAEEAVGTADQERMMRDPAYAGSIADHLTILRSDPRRGADDRAAIDQLLVSTLATAGRHDQAENIADSLLRARPAEPDSYRSAFLAAVVAERWSRAAILVDRAAAALPAAGSADLFSQDMVEWLLQATGQADAGEPRVRIAQALVRSGWPSRNETSWAADRLREILIDHELAQGNVPEARRLAGEMRGLGTVLRLSTGRRYDPIYGTDDRLARIRAAIEREDRDTAQRLAAEPEDTERLVARASFLRSVGRDRAVLDLLLPLMGEVRLVAQRHEEGLWLVNEAAYALIATGAAGEAVELMRPLFTMDVDANPNLVNTSINFVSILWQAGQNEEALQRAETFMAEDADHASDYGEMWIFANAICAATDLGRRDAAESWLQRAAAIADSNRSAMLQALLCRNDLEAAERVLLAALEDEDTQSRAILWLQDYDPMPHADSAQRLREAFARLRARPAVESAFARLGHRLRLPMTAVVYGWY